MLRGITSLHVQGLKVHTRSTNVETKTQQPIILVNWLLQRVNKSI